ncbi:unnamed protein product [Nesidiocoris tenuis]|uniref:Endonuclease n=1 Tax=Nesidiocoris tenuis TaxID=355587 RepID=A0A6H5GQR1_9HEMI|nr:unnamed protein product [Nesidiocoris tenuis]
MNTIRSLLKKTGVQAAFFAAFGAAAWYGGSYYERQRCREKLASLGLPVTLSEYPQFPITPIISAAEVDQNRVALVQKRTSEIMRFGFPSLNNVRYFDDFLLSYDNRTRVANWVFEHLTEENLKVKDNVNRELCQFVEDPTIHQFFRSTNADYYRSGYDRGHLAAAGNHKLQQSHCDQTFTLSNIAPQVGVGFNRGAWNRLEKYVRAQARHNSNVYVCTGPVFKPHREADGKKYVKYEVIGERDVAVPTHFFKVIVMEGHDNKLTMEAYLMPNQPINDNAPLTQYLVRIIRKSLYNNNSISPPTKLSK